MIYVGFIHVQRLGNAAVTVAVAIALCQGRRHAYQYIVGHSFFFH